MTQTWKCQEKVRYIMDTFYGNKPDALSGNDDCGQMSAWYIFNTMGFYPTAPSSNVYNLGSPGLAAVDMKMSNGKHLRMTTGNWSARNVFVKEVYLNGKKYDKSYITYNDIKDGADLHFVMSSRPNYKRGVAERAVPPSVSEKR